MVFDKALGGWAPSHNRGMESTTEGIYVAGDTTGLEEASTAIEEGNIAGTAAAKALGKIEADKADKLIEEGWKRLDRLRSGFKSEERVAAKHMQLSRYEEVKKGE